MNPLELLDIFETKQIDDLSKENYSHEEVLDLIKKSFNFARKAYMEGDFIFTLEDINSKEVIVNTVPYKISQIKDKDNKKILLMQMTDVPEGDITISDMEQLSNNIHKSIENSDNIKGAMILPPNYNINLMYAKLDTSTYEVPIMFTEEDKKILDKIKNNNINKFNDSKINKSDIYNEIDYDFTNSIIKDKPEKYKNTMIKTVNKMQKIFDNDMYLKSLMNNNIDLKGIEEYIENTYGIIVCAKTDINNFVKLEVLGTNSSFID